MTVQFVQVLVDCPTDERLFTYTWEGVIQPGDGVWVPFAGRFLGGIVVTVQVEAPAEQRKLKAIASILHRSFLPVAYWQLLEKIAAYYCTPLIQVVQSALPPGVLTRAQRRIRRQEGDPSQLSSPARQLWEHLATYQRHEAAWRELQKRIPNLESTLRELERQNLATSYLHTPPPPRPKVQTFITLLDPLATGATTRQEKLIQTLRHLGGELPLAAFIEQATTTRATVLKLAEQGWIALSDREILRREAGDQQPMTPDQPKTLTSAQAQALQQIQHLARGETLLLWGVTGSGKTEVYLQAIAPVLAQGKSALVLVPEIGLTPQLTNRFRARFPGKVWVYHSALAAGERFDSWRQMLAGEAQVVVGTRSAVFAPLPQLGLIILDEEHDTSYKQDTPAPAYHARTVAQWRSQIEGCPLLLGSATPALESFRATQTAQFQLAQLSERVGGQGLAQVQVVDMRAELTAGVFSPLSRALQTALAQTIERGEQAILFLNRRGFHTFILCRNCGEVLTCPHCAVSLTYHATDRILRCHHCHYTQTELQQVCPSCQSPHFRYFGTGTQRIASAVLELFPELRILRFDQDTTQRKGAHRQILEQFSQGEADVLIGTQMLTKGLDVPQVTLVGILAADSLLHLPDFRCPERAFQLMTQVAGRSGRGAVAGEVILQTYAPDHPVVIAAARQDYLAFTLPELECREELGYPPFGRLVSFLWQGMDETIVRATAQFWAEQLGQLAGEVLGPAPALIPKLRQSYRWQVLWKLPLNIAPQPLLQPLLASRHGVKGVSCRVDIDPLHL